MQVSAIMLRISLAEQQSIFYTILVISELLKSQSIPLRFLRSISLLAQLSGLPMQISLLKRLFAAESSSLGKLVAPITSTSPFFGLFTPSIKTRNYVLSLLEASFQFSERAVSIESISSMKMIEGLTCSAAVNTFRIIFQDSPTNLFKIEDADNAKKVHPDSLARALQMQVLPFPGGPQRSSPLGGALMPVQRSGRRRGRITASSSRDFASARPTISLKLTSSFLTMSYSTAGSSQTLGLYFSNMGFLFSCQVLSLGLSSGGLSCFMGGCPSRFTFCLELRSGKPNFVILIWLASFCCSLAVANAFSSRYLLIFCFKAYKLSLEVAWGRVCLRSRTILSQQRTAQSQLPSLRKLSALTVSAFAQFSVYILNLKKMDYKYDRCSPLQPNPKGSNRQQEME